MGAGNVRTHGRCEGTYYIDNDFLDVYRRMNEDGDYEYRRGRNADEEFELDVDESWMSRLDFQSEFNEEFTKRFRSFERVDRWISGSRRAILENKLFYVVLEDNLWSLAIELIAKEVEPQSETLQMTHYKKYLEAMKQILLNMFEEVGFPTGCAWTHGILRRN